MDTRTGADLMDDLRHLGLREGNTVMVHASLRAIGPVEGGAATVIDALDAAVGRSGTLLMTLGARDDWDWVNARPETDRAELLANADAFRHNSTPADPDNGVLAEVFRQRPGTMVSNHPDGRFGARGHLAADLVNDVPWHDYYGPGSTLERLIGNHGKVLRLGADLNTLTLLHYAEYLVPLAGKRRIRRHHLVVGPDEKPIVREVEGLDDSDGIVDFPGEDYFALILKAYLSSGRASTGVVGGAQSELIDAADVVDFGVSWMTQHLGIRTAGPAASPSSSPIPPLRPSK